MTAKVYRDAWGVPHLRADDPLELARLQGRNAATDRGWQIELERRRSQGTTAAFAGAGALPWDRFARQARLDDTAQRCFAALDDDTRAWVSAYVDGVNSGLPAGARRAPEFAATGLEPTPWEPWVPLGIWMSVHVLFAGFPTLLWHEQVAEHLGEAAIDVFNSEGPGTTGSNGWLVDGQHTVTGEPIIAGDPHRVIQQPGIYQQLRLACPEYDVVGLAVPGVPGIAHFGHAEEVAWAITNAMADYQDLYRERLRRTDSGVEALGPDGWRPAEVRTETIEVADAEAVQVEVVETERGPVVVGGPDDTQAISLRHPPRVTSRLGFETIAALLRATTTADVDTAFDQWVEPVNVLMAADTRGGRLHRVAGLVPRRHPDNRVRVVPGWSADHRWDGWFDPMPRATVDGIAVMANERGLATPLGTEFAAPHRARRIRELLTGRDKWSAADMPVVHTDTYLATAEPVLALLAGLDELTPEATRLRDRLMQWDRQMDAESNDAGAYAAVRSGLVRRIAAHPVLAGLEVQPDVPRLFRPWTDVMSNVVFAMENLLATELLPEIDRGELARQALEEVAAGPAPVPWGQTHQLAPIHALLWPIADPAEEPVELGLSGDHNCVMSTSSLPGDSDLCPRGSVVRFAWDLARREDSRWIVPLGASGVPGDPHHHDQLPLWRRGELAPVVTDWHKLTEEADH